MQLFLRIRYIFHDNDGSSVMPEQISVHYMPEKNKASGLQGTISLHYASLLCTGTVRCR